jgi:hypothetical protein
MRPRSRRLDNSVVLQLLIDYFLCIAIIARMAYVQRQYEHHYQGSDDQRKQFSGAHISIGSVKYAVGAVALMLLGEKIKNPEQRYLVLAGLSAIVGAIDTAWRDHVRARDRTEKEACWRDRHDQERISRETERR